MKYDFSAGVTVGNGTFAGMVLVSTLSAMETDGKTMFQIFDIEGLEKQKNVDIVFTVNGIAVPWETLCAQLQECIELNITKRAEELIKEKFQNKFYEAEHHLDRMLDTLKESE